MEVPSPVSHSPFRIGVLLSSTGPYSVVAGAMLNGVLLAADRVLAETGHALNLAIKDPGGCPERYPELCEGLLRSGIRHVIGCYTSSSRKDVIPLFEKHDALLWYPSHYEGFETSTNTIYIGAVPNQHVIPLVRHLLDQGRTRAFCIGSNYVWAWENNRILRDELTRHGGAVLAERYLPVGQTDVAAHIDAILTAAPDVVFSTLIGCSSYGFLNAFRAACTQRGIDQPRQMPVASCSLSEPELDAIGPAAVEGHISASVYFASITSPENAVFTAAHQARFPEGPTMSADAEAAYVATLLLSRALDAAGSDDVAAVRCALSRQRLAAPQGEVWIDDQTSHAYLTPRIGLSNRHAQFDIIMEASAPVQADPYLVRSSARLEAAQPTLRLVS